MNKQNDKQTNQGSSRKLVSISSTLHQAREFTRRGRGTKWSCTEDEAGGRVAAGTSTSAGPQCPSDDAAPPCSVLKQPTAGYTLQKLSMRTFQMRKWNLEVRYLSYPVLAWEPQAQPASRKHQGTATHKLTRNENVSVYVPVNKWYATKEIAPVTRKWAGWFHGLKTTASACFAATSSSKRKSRTEPCALRRRFWSSFASLVLW